jgi:putative RecB family exonuclease
MIDYWRAPLLYDGGMYPVPTSLSPSRVEAFTSCPMAFRFASIEHLPESPSPHTTKGSLVHRVLELLFLRPPAARTITAARSCFQQAVDEYALDPEFTLLHLDDAQQEAFVDDAWSLVEAYFRMEDPTGVREIGIELRLEAQVGNLALRGIIDRLELDADGGLVVTDYKTGRAPGLKYEQGRLAGVLFYSFLCE